MQQKAKLVCINPDCGKAFSIRSLAIKCDVCNFLLDIYLLDATGMFLLQIRVYNDIYPLDAVPMYETAVD